MDSVPLQDWILLTVLLLLSAFFSGSETALTSISHLRVHHLVETKVPNATLVERMLKKPNRLLATILVGNNLVNIGASALATSIALRLFGDAGIGIAVAVLTVVVLIFGELTPKTYAASNEEQVALLVVKPLSLLEYLFYPLIKALGTIANALVRALGGKIEPKRNFVTEEEIRSLVNASEEEGQIETEEKEMIDSIFQLNDTLVREVMVPRIDITAIAADKGFREALALFIETGHSRIPVYKNSLDNILGILYAKDLMRHCSTCEQEGQVREIMREAFFVPESKRASDLLRDLRKKKLHIAVALDEYGGTAGLAFLEDLIEEVIGQMGDEYDPAEAPLIQTLGSGEISASARVLVEDINELLDVDLPMEEYDTIGGLAFYLFGRVPKQGESIEFADVELTVESIKGNRIQKIRLFKKIPAGSL